MEYVLMCAMSIASFMVGTYFERMKALGFIRGLNDSVIDDESLSKKYVLGTLMHSAALMSLYYGDCSLDKKLAKHLAKHLANHFENPENYLHTLINKSNTKKGHEKCPQKAHKRRQDDPRK